MNLYLKDNGQKVTLIGLPQLGGIIVAAILLHWASTFSYLLFHSLIELSRILVLSGIFVLAWHSRRWAISSFLLLVGISSLFVAALELLHALAYKGLGVFAGYDANLPTELWIAFRYLESLSLLAAALLAERRFSPLRVVAFYAATTAAIVFAIFSGLFPDCFVEGRGLTDFKVGSEYAIIALLFAAIAALWHKRNAFDPAVLRLLIASIGAGILAELAFTRYVSVFGPANEFGHYLLLVSTYLIYRSVLVTGLISPFDLMFRSLKKKEQELEAKVEERTRALKLAQAQADAFADNSPALFYLTDLEQRHTFINAAFERLFGKPQREILGKTIFEFAAAGVAAPIDRANRDVLAGGQVAVDTEILRLDDGERCFETIRFPVRDDRGQVIGVGGIGTDISERRLAEERYGTVIRASMDAFLIIDAQGRFVEANDAACALTGYDRDRLLRLRYSDVEAGQDAGAVAATLGALAKKGKMRFDSRWKNAAGDIRDVEVSIMYLGEAGGGEVFAFVRDITERKAAVARIEFLAHHDVLTGLANKLLFQERFALLAERAALNRRKLAMVYLDLDNFKDINDTLGHVVGDKLLQGMAVRLGECVGGSKRIGRIGGDEFLVLLEGGDGTTNFADLTQRILEHVSAPLLIDPHELASTVSVGVSLYPDDGKDFDTLFTKADTAMFRAKEAGRNTYRFFDESMNADALERLNMLGRLRGAIERDELVLHYQPQIDLDSGRVVGAEALLRWHDPEHGLIAPGRFIPIAEDSGLIVPIGAWVLREACRQAVAWQQAGLPEIVVAVNLSAVQFRRPDLQRTVVGALLESGLDAHCLELELTESILIHDTESVLDTVHRLKALGLKLSIDDFGTGYSSLSYLRRFAVDKLKIDQSFVRDMDQDPENAALVHAIVQMARSLGLRTIAEGVERQELIDLLRLYHCDEAQGYLYAKPLPAAQFADFLSARSELAATAA